MMMMMMMLDIFCQKIKGIVLSQILNPQGMSYAFFSLVKKQYSCVWIMGKEQTNKVERGKALYSFVYTSMPKQRIFIILHCCLKINGLYLPCAISKESASHFDVEVLVFPTSQGSQDSPVTSEDDWVSPQIDLPILSYSHQP